MQGFGTYEYLMLYAALPLMVGAFIAPPWKVAAVFWVAYTARAAVALGGMGVMPIFIVAVAAVMGFVLAYMREERARQQFVRARRAR